MKSSQWGGKACLQAVGILLCVLGQHGLKPDTHGYVDVYYWVGLPWGCVRCQLFGRVYAWVWCNATTIHGSAGKSRLAYAVQDRGWAAIPGATYGGIIAVSPVVPVGCH